MTIKYVLYIIANLLFYELIFDAQVFNSTHLKTWFLNEFIVSNLNYIS